MKRFCVTVNGKEYEVGVRELGDEAASTPTQNAARPPAAVPAPAPAAAAPAGARTVAAPMPGKILSVRAAKGAAVKRGDVLLILEAMKMANEITAPMDGVVAEVRVNPGQNVKTGDVMLIFG